MRRTFTVLAIAAMLLTIAVPASATIIDRGRGSDTYEFDFEEGELCDFGIEVTGHVTFNYRIREGKNRQEQAYFLQVHESFVEVFRVGDRHVTVSFHGTLNETRAVPLGGGLFQFYDVQAGTMSVRDADGKVIGRIAGAFRSTYTFDSLNDDQPGGDVIGEIDESFHGRFEDLDPIICAALASPSGP